MSQEVLADSVSDLLAQQADEGEFSPEPEFAEGMNTDYPSEQQIQQDHELARQEMNRSRLSSRVTRQFEVNAQDQPQAHNAQEIEQVPSYTAQIIKLHKSDCIGARSKSTPLWTVAQTLKVLLLLSSKAA